MDRDQIKGDVKKGIGKAKEEWGKATDDPETEAEGEQEQSEGGLQHTWGDAKNAARNAVDEKD